MGVTPDSILKLCSLEERNVPGEGRVVSCRGERGGRRFGHYHRRELDGPIHEVHRRGPSRKSDQNGHGQDRDRGRAGAHRLHCDECSILKVEDSMVQPRTEVGRDIQGRKGPKEVPSGLQCIGIPPAPFACRTVGFHLLRDPLLCSSIEELGELGEVPLAVHQLLTTPSDGPTHRKHRAIPLLLSLPSAGSPQAAICVKRPWNTGK